MEDCNNSSPKFIPIESNQAVSVSVEQQQQRLTSAIRRESIRAVAHRCGVSSYMFDRGNNETSRKSGPERLDETLFIRTRLSRSPPNSQHMRAERLALRDFQNSTLAPLRLTNEIQNSIHAPLCLTERLNSIVLQARRIPCETQEWRAQPMATLASTE